jgi:large repetitive protein
VTNLWQYNKLNQLTNTHNGSYSYDLEGRLTKRVVNGVTNYFEWSGGELSVIRDGAGNVVATYYYDLFGRRLRKVVGGVTNWYLYSDEGLIAEMNATGAVLRTYGSAPGSLWNNNPLYLKEGSNYYWYACDHLGAPQKLMAENGTVVWSAEFDAFGWATVASNSVVTNNLRFSSQYFDAESGLHYNTYRYYEPEGGTFISRDPLGEPKVLHQGNASRQLRNRCVGVDPRQSQGQT